MAAEASVYASPCGPIALHVRDGRLARVELLPPGHAAVLPHAHIEARPFVEALDRYFAGGEARVPRDALDLSGAGAFDRRVYEALLGIPRGRLITYGGLAALAGCPRGARAVGGAVGRNPLPVFVPCHRVVPRDGRLGGFGAGPQWKICLLALEGWVLEAGRLRSQTR